MKLLATATLAIASFSSAAGDARPQTLAEIVRAHGGPIDVATEREFSPAELPEIVRDADLIAIVVVLDNGTSYVSADGRRIYSDFSVQINEKYFMSPAVVIAETITVSKPGGSITLAGYPVTAYERDFPPFSANEQYVLFLKYDPDAKHWIVPYGAQGAFRVGAGAVEQVSKDTGTWNRANGRVPLDVFVKQVTQFIRPVPQP